MSFKLSNVRDEESQRIFEKNLSSQSIEIITSTATSNPSIPTTQVYADTVDYTITLPNGEPGKIKCFSMVSSAERTVTIAFNQPYSGSPRTVNTSSPGDFILFYATPYGWHYNFYD